MKKKIYKQVKQAKNPFQIRKNRLREAVKILDTGNRNQLSCWAGDDRSEADEVARSVTRRHHTGIQYEMFYDEAGVVRAGVPVLNSRFQLDARSDARRARAILYFSVDFTEVLNTNSTCGRKPFKDSHKYEEPLNVFSGNSNMR